MFLLLIGYGGYGTRPAVENAVAPEYSVRLRQRMRPLHTPEDEFVAVKPPG